MNQHLLYRLLGSRIKHLQRLIVVSDFLVEMLLEEYMVELIQLLELAPSTVSRHMGVLYQARLVESRKEGRWIYYRLSDREAPTCALEAIEWVRKSLRSDPRIREDAKRLKSVLEMSRDELCARYKR